MELNRKSPSSKENDDNDTTDNNENENENVKKPNKLQCNICDKDTFKTKTGLMTKTGGLGGKPRGRGTTTDG